MADLYYIESGYFTPDGYYVYTADAQAAIVSEATQTTNATNIKQFAADCGSLFTPSLIVDILKNSTAVLDAVASVSASANVIKDSAISLSSACSTSTSADRLRSSAVSLTVTSTMSVTSGQTELGSADLISSFAQSVDAVANRSADIALSTIVTLSAQADRLRGIADLVASSGSMSIDAVKTTDTSINQSSSFTSSTQATKAFGFIVASSSAFSTNILAVKTVQSVISAGALFTPGVAANILKNHTAVLDAVATLSLTPKVTRTLSAAASSAFSQSVSTVKTVRTAVSISSQTTVTSIIGSRKQFAVTLPVYGSIYCRLDERYFRPLQFQSKTVSASINTDNPKFGSGYADNGSGNIKWYAHSSLMPNASNGSLQIEYWQRNIPSSTSAAAAIQFQDNIGVLWEIRTYYLGPTSSRGVTFRYRTSSGASPTYQSVVGQYTFTAPSDWNYIAFRKNNGSGGALWINGTRVFYNSNFDISWQNQNTPGTLIIGQTEPTYAYIAVDEVKISKPFYLTGLNPESTTIPVPTQPFTNDIDTVALFHFNGDFTDDISEIEQAQASIISTASVTANLSYISVNNSANLISNSSITISGGKLQNVSANIQSNVNLNSSVVRTKQLGSNFNSLTQVNATVKIIRSAQSSLASTFNLTANNTRRRTTAVTTQAIATELAAVVKIGQGLIGMDAVITTAISAVKTTSISQSVTAISSLVADVDLIALGTANLSSSLTLSSQANRTRNNPADINAEFNLTTDPIKTVVGNSVLNVTSNLVVENSGLLTGSADLNTISSLSADITRNRVGSSALSSNATLVSDPITVLQAVSTIDSSSTVVVINSRIRATAVQTDSIATQLTAVAKTGQGFITLESVASVVCNSVKLPVGSVNAYADTAMVIQPGTIKLANATATASFALTADGVTGIIGESYNSATFTQTTTAVKNVAVDVTATSAVVLTATVKRTRTVGINLVASAGEVIVGRRVKYGQAALITQSTLSASAGINVVIINQTLFNNVSLTAAVRSIHIDPYTTWMIAEEDRTRKISQEVRTRTIEAETRTYIIEGA